MCSCPGGGIVRRRGPKSPVLWPYEFELSRYRDFGIVTRGSQLSPILLEQPIKGARRLCGIHSRYLTARCQISFAPSVAPTATSSDVFESGSFSARATTFNADLTQPGLSGERA